MSRLNLPHRLLPRAGAPDWLGESKRYGAGRKILILVRLRYPRYAPSGQVLVKAGRNIEHVTHVCY